MRDVWVIWKLIVGVCLAFVWNLLGICDLGLEFNVLQYGKLFGCYSDGVEEGGEKEKVGQNTKRV